MPIFRRSAPFHIRCIMPDNQAVYQANAVAFDEQRSVDLFEENWLKRFAALIPKGGTVLDLGCGSGRPIAQWFAKHGFQVTGVDFAPAMVELARHTLPDAEWHVQDLRDLELNREFDGVLGWNSFFHLTGDDQRTVLPRLVRHVKPGGPIMVTVGPGEGEVNGWVNGCEVFHASLSLAEYSRRFEALGASVVDFKPEDAECQGHTILLAQRRPVQDI